MAFVTPVPAVAGRALASSFAGEKCSTFKGTAVAAKAAAPAAPSTTFEVKAAVPLLAYKPKTTNTRVASIGENLSIDKPARYNIDYDYDNGEKEEVIAAAYRQIFGEHQTIAYSRQVTLDSQLRNGQISVRQFIRGLVLSEQFLNQNFETATNYRFVEKLVQRVLGRDVYSNLEKIAWSIVIANKGVEGFVDELLASEEYLSNFGENTVPFQRNRVLAGRATGDKPFNIKNARVNRFQTFVGSSAGTGAYRAAVFNSNVLDQTNRADFATSTGVQGKFQEPVVADKMRAGIAPIKRGYENGASIPFLKYAPKCNNPRVFNFGVRLSEEQAAEYTDAYDQTLLDKDAIIKAAYNRLYSEHQSIKFTKQPTLECQFRNGDLTVKEFVRALCTSPAFLSLNYNPNSNYRFAELCVQRILGRDLFSEREAIAWSIVICNKGAPGFIDALLDSEEYKQAFGDNILPYQRARKINNRAQGETPFLMKTPRYGEYYRKNYAGFYFWNPVVTNYVANDKVPKTGDPRNFAKLVPSSVKVNAQKLQLVGFDYLAKVPSKSA